MDRRNFTQRVIECLPTPKSKRTVYYDEQVKGLCILVQPTGHRAFGWYRKVNGKPTFRSIDPHPDVTIQQARDTAEEWNGKLQEYKRSHYQGPNPFEKKKAVEPVPVPTVRELLDAYVKYIREKGTDEKRLPEKIERAVYQVNWSANRYFPPSWFDRPMDSITLDDVLAAKRSQGTKRYSANRCVELVRSMFNWSAGTKDGKVRFYKCSNPAVEVGSFKEEKRVRYLDDEELLRVNEALQKEPSEDLHDALVCLLWTGARRSDVFSMRWSDVKLGARTWRVPFPKGGNAYTVDLLPEVVSVLEKRRARLDDSETYVFPGVGKTGHLIDLKKQWNEFRTRAKLENFRLHDFRHTCASMQASAGVPLLVIKDNLGHQSLQSTERYSHLLNEVKLEAREAGRAKMLAMMKAAKRRAKLAARKPKVLSAAVGRG